MDEVCLQSSFNKNMKDLDQLLTETKEAIKNIRNQNTLSHLPQDVTVEEIKSEMELLHGQSIMCCIQADNKKFDIVISPKNTRVSDLKRTIERQITMQMKRKGLSKQISWRHVWKSYWLSFDGIKLTNEKSLLSELGIENQCEITFVKRLKDKVRIK
ncbi:hypothetical protein M8J77_019740 [Diaphorina citri]|nr:hypothetical protein M8J77_019740 [Diaphorina citri]